MIGRYRPAILQNGCTRTVYFWLKYSTAGCGEGFIRSLHSCRILHLTGYILSAHPGFREEARR